MTDRSKIIRHPDVLREEFRSISMQMTSMRFKLKELAEQLDQVADIAEQMMGQHD